MLLSLHNVCFKYGKKTILNNVSFNLDRGECLVITGANGSGKSTLLSIIAGILHKSSGEIELSSGVAYAVQDDALFDDMTVRDNLSFFADVYHVSLPGEYPFDISDILNKKIYELSGGMKKRVSIACALLSDADLLLLDESANSLDENYRCELIDLIHSLKESGKSVIYVGHNKAEYESFADKIYHLSADGGEMHSVGADK